METFAEALDRAIARRKVTLSWLSRRCTDLGDPVSAATLSYWRSGQRAPHNDASFEVLVRLEELLGLDPAELTALIPPQRRPGPDKRRTFGEIFNVSEAQTNLFQAIGFKDPYAAALTGWSYVLDYGQDRQVQRMRVLSHWEARSDGVASVPLYWGYDSPVVRLPDVEVVGGALKERMFDRDACLEVAECVLPRPLARGETAITEHTLVGAVQQEPESSMMTVAERRTTETSIWLRFHPSTVPSRCWEQVETADGSERRRVQAVGNALHIIRRGFGPGAFGFKWEWGHPRTNRRPVNSSDRP